MEEEHTSMCLKRLVMKWSLCLARLKPEHSEIIYTLISLFLITFIDFRYSKCNRHLRNFTQTANCMTEVIFPYMFYFPNFISGPFYRSIITEINLLCVSPFLHYLHDQILTRSELTLKIVFNLMQPTQCNKMHIFYYTCATKWYDHIKQQPPPAPHK